MKCIIADDHGMVRTGIREVLKAIEPQMEILEAGTFGDLLRLLKQDAGIDLIILDLVLPGTQRLEGLQHIRTRYPTSAVVVVSAKENPNLMHEALSTGISGYIPKSTPADVLPAAFRLILAGGIYVPPGILLTDTLPVGDWAEPEDAEQVLDIAQLTKRQREILSALGQGASNREIAMQLGLAEQTIKNHVSKILKVLGVPNRAQAALKARSGYEK
jgi:DNA-binding NarL/FixJ family response regulator